MAAVPERVVFLNGKWVPESRATISIFDAAVALGDTVTESTRTFGHKPFRLDDHLERLGRSLKVTRIPCELEPEALRELTLEVIRRNLPCYGPGADFWIVHNISRGLFHPSGDPSQRRSCTVMIYTLPMDLKYWARFYVDGCHAVTPPTRLAPAQSMDARIKNRSRMNYTLAELEVKLVDPAAQGIILDTNGFLAENKGGNFFLVTDGRLRTPRSTNALAGLSRATVLELAARLGIPAEEADLLPYDAYTADEAFFTSTPYCIMPATRFNGLPVGTGRVGPVTVRLLRAWSDLVGVDIAEQGLDQLPESEAATCLERWRTLGVEP